MTNTPINVSKPLFPINHTTPELSFFELSYEDIVKNSKVSDYIPYSVFYDTV